MAVRACSGLNRWERGRRPAASRAQDRSGIEAQVDGAGLGAEGEVGPDVGTAGPGAEAVLSRVDEKVTGRRGGQLEGVGGGRDLLWSVPGQGEAGAAAAIIGNGLDRQHFLGGRGQGQRAQIGSVAGFLGAGVVD